MNEETQTQTLDIGGVEVPLTLPEGHIVTGAVLLVTTASMDEHGAIEGFICTSSSMPNVQLVGMLRTATIEVEADVSYGGCACEDHDD